MTSSDAQRLFLALCFKISTAELFMVQGLLWLVECKTNKCLNAYTISLGSEHIPIQGRFPVPSIFLLDEYLFCLQSLGWNYPMIMVLALSVRLLAESSSAIHIRHNPVTLLSVVSVVSGIYRLSTASKNVRSLWLGLQFLDMHLSLTVASMKITGCN